MIVSSIFRHSFGRVIYASRVPSPLNFIVRADRLRDGPRPF
jgi:hypothetical protein